MKKLSVWNLVMKLMIIAAGFLIGLAIMAIHERYQEATANWRSEAVCIQGWIDMGMDRKDIHRLDGDCFYAKTFNVVKEK